MHLPVKKTLGILTIALFLLAILAQPVAAGESSCGNCGLQNCPTCGLAPAPSDDCGGCNLPECPTCTPSRESPCGNCGLPECPACQHHPAPLVHNLLFFENETTALDAAAAPLYTLSVEEGADLTDEQLAQLPQPNAPPELPESAVFVGWRNAANDTLFTLQAPLAGYATAQTIRLYPSFESPAPPVKAPAAKTPAPAPVTADGQTLSPNPDGTYTLPDITAVEASTWVDMANQTCYVPLDTVPLAPGTTLVHCEYWNAQYGSTIQIEISLTNDNYTGTSGQSAKIGILPLLQQFIVPPNYSIQLPGADYYANFAPAYDTYGMQITEWWQDTSPDWDPNIYPEPVTKYAPGGRVVIGAWDEKFYANLGPAAPTPVSHTVTFVVENATGGTLAPNTATTPDSATATRVTFQVPDGTPFKQNWVPTAQALSRSSAEWTLLHYRPVATSPGNTGWWTGAPGNYSELAAFPTGAVTTDLAYTARFEGYWPVQFSLQPSGADDANATLAPQTFEVPDGESWNTYFATATLPTVQCQPGYVHTGWQVVDPYDQSPTYGPVATTGPGAQLATDITTDRLHHAYAIIEAASTVTLTGQSHTTVYNGAPQSTGVFKVAGLSPGDTITIGGTAYTVSPTGTIDLGAGGAVGADASATAYTTNLAGLLAAGDVSVPGRSPLACTVTVAAEAALTIAPRPLTITANSAAGTLPGSFSAGGYRTETTYPGPGGLLAGHLLEGLAAGRSESTAGRFEVTFTGTPVIYDGPATAPRHNVTTNYDIRLVSGWLTIQPVQVVPPPSSATPAAPTPAASGSATSRPSAPPRPAGPATSSTPSASAAPPAPGTSSISGNAPVPPQSTSGAPPAAIIDGGATPAAPPRGGWSLLNLLVAVVCLLLALVLLPGLFRRTATPQEEQRDDCDKTPRRRKNIVFRLLALLAGVAAPLTFFLVENLPSPMVFVNHWSPLMLAVLGVQLIAVLLLRRARAKTKTNAA